ncbi:excinuclease ABC subunit UvrB [Phycisphaerales bacterium AB-hyl4]|uniref:UvrABC system protein B n=1 Tax=Natronomicrosphaera hydrolytica TaxID=3242702 RepID=A0ABV4U231_9BACT
MPTPDRFQLVSEYQPTGDQPAAIDALTQGLNEGRPHQTLLGATGTGKTFTMANVIERVNKPTLVISHNKTLAAQLYEEFKELFPHNAVSYFVSYYDYYQPEAYIPQRDIYIEKDASRNDDLDRLRLAATSSLVSRNDVLVVASVSCIFGLGSPEEYKQRVVSLRVGQTINRRDMLRALADLQYSRSEYELARGKFRVRGDVVEIFPAAEEFAYRVELFGDEIESLAAIHPTSGELLADEKAVFIYPAVHYVMPENQLDQAVDSITQELEYQTGKLRSQGKLLEAQRLQARTKYDLEMIQEVGYCSGIENYSRHLDGRPPGSRPYTLLDYFMLDRHGSNNPKSEIQNSKFSDWLLLIDESHVTIPQLHAMYHGDKQRKQVLVDHGFRLPSAMDNRPLTFEEIEKLWPQTIFVSATPAKYELEKCHGEIVEQIIRPTGLVDPIIEVRPAATQVPDLIELCKARTANGQRVLVTTLTKRMAEDLTRYLDEADIKCRYLHSDVETLDRVQILRELREGEYDVLVGVNLLREGLDLPEVSAVAILDADKSGFLRSPTSLIQQIGRAARNVDAFVVLYADEVTPGMQMAIDETNRRRDKQLAYNAEHNITPQTIKKAIRMGIELELRARKTAREAIGAESEEEYDREQVIAEIEAQMLEAAQMLEFEKAAALRDKLKQVKDSPDMGKIKVSRNGEPKAKPGSPGSKAGKPRKKKRSTQ